MRKFKEDLLTVIINYQNTSIHLWINLIYLYVARSPVLSHYILLYCVIKQPLSIRTGCRILEGVGTFKEDLLQLLFAVNITYSRINLVTSH